MALRNSLTGSLARLFFGSCVTTAVFLTPCVSAESNGVVNGQNSIESKGMDGPFLAIYHKGSSAGGRG